MKNNKVKKMVAVSFFSAMGLVLQFISFPIIPAFPFMKIDFSEIPVLLGMFLYGPLAGIVTAFLRSFLHLFMTGIADPANMLGDLASFMATMCFTLPVYYLYQGMKKYQAKNQIWGLLTGSLSMTSIMSIANYYVITPLYLKFYYTTETNMLGMSLAKYITVGVVPFNLIKSFILSSVFLVLYAKLLPWLSKKQIGTVNYK